MSTAITHPEAGNAALCMMRLSYSADPERIASEAGRLNSAEPQGDTATSRLGSWCQDPQSDTTSAFCASIPNALAQWS